MCRPVVMLLAACLAPTVAAAQEADPTARLVARLDLEQYKATIKDLTTATQIAVQQAIDFIAAYRGWAKMEAYRLVSVGCDVRITELVDGNVGVHVMIPKSLIVPHRRIER